jgi:asparagine synthetase B (glutamine-hydrolysing)
VLNVNLPKAANGQPRRVAMLSARLAFSWLEPPSAPFREDVFFGAWLPGGYIEIACDEAPAGFDPVVANTGSSAIISNSILRNDQRIGMVHARPRPQQEQPHAVAFRGYITSAGLHSWSDERAIFDYWSRHKHRTHNGVFAAALIYSDRLQLICDPLGVSPLYYRQFSNGIVLFSTSPRYLRVAGDTSNPLACRIFAHRNALCGDISLVPNVSRVGPGQTITFNNGQIECRQWFRLEDLGCHGTREIDLEGLAEEEAAFQTAVDRCLSILPSAPCVLPLSGGDDSRRILAALYRRQWPYRAVTVRGWQKGGRDLDARYSAQLAARFGFDHTIVDLPDADRWIIDDRSVRRLFSSEIDEHCWIGALYRAFDPRGSLILDGLGGDIFGNTGFGLPELHTMPEPEKLLAIANEALPDTTAFRKDAWVPLIDARRFLVRHLESVPHGNNRADYAFALIRMRRGTALATQHGAPAGSAPIYPYLDLDYIRTAMQFHPLRKIPPDTLQKRALQAFWPEFFAIPGSRRFPPDVPVEGVRAMDALAAARIRALRAGCDSNLLDFAREILEPRHYAAAVMAGFSSSLERRCRWFLNRLLVLEAHRRERAAWRSIEVEGIERAQGLEAARCRL